MSRSDPKTLPVGSLSFVSPTTRAAGLLLATVLLSACADERQRVADWLAPPTAAEMMGRMDQQVAAGNVAEAIRMGEAFVAGQSGASSAEVHRMLARLLIEQGDAAGSLRHLQAADPGASAAVVVTSGGTAPSAAPAAPPAAAPAPAQAPVASKPAQPSPPIPDVSATAGGVSASVRGGKVEARAGNVSARVLP
jgi:hypothetical protein